MGIGLFLFNLAGCIVYVARASAGWVNPREHGMIPITGEPFVWFVGIFPVVVTCALVDILWGVYIASTTKRRGWYLWLASIPIWFVAVWVDFAHH